MDKKKCVISFRSQTYSMKACMLLAEKSIKAKTVTLGIESTDKGCTVGIEIDCKDFINATKILNNAQIRYGVPK